MQRKKQQLKPQKEQQSINFADSLANTATTEAPGMKPPEYSATTADPQSDQKTPNESNGSITFYCNGFLPGRDYLGNETRDQAAENDSQGNGETMHKDDTSIEGGENYWGAIDEQLEERFTGKEPNADSTFYFDGSAGPLSSAKDRMEYGEAAGHMIIRQVQGGEFNLDENGCLPDTINVVGHSMGAAYAAGLAKTLLQHNEDQGKTVFNVRAVYYFAPHQPGDIEHPSSIRGVQYSHKNDAVTSQGDSDDMSALWGLIPKVAGSNLAPINGIHEFMVHDVPGLDQSVIGDRGGHNIEDHEYTLDLYKPGRDGYIAPNSDSDYDEYKNQTVSQDGYEKQGVDLPKLLDKLESLPSDVRAKISELEEWMNQNVNNANSIFKEKVGQGQEWLDEKREDGKDWVDEKINEGDEWIDEKVDKGNDKIDDEIDKATDWLNSKSGGLLGGEIGKLSDWVRGKKDKAVDKVNNKEDDLVEGAQSKVNEANLWLESKTSDLASWVTEKSDGIAAYVNEEVSEIASWAREQVNKGEKAAIRMMKTLQKKLKALIKRIQRKIESIRKRIIKVIAIIKETEAWS